MNNINDQVAARLKEYRRRAGLTQEALAFNANIHVSFVSEIERGLKKPSIESLGKLLSALHVSFQEFFDFDTPVNPDQKCAALEKINFELHSRSDEEIEMIYNIIRQILKYNDQNASRL